MENKLFSDKRFLIIEISNQYDVLTCMLDKFQEHLEKNMGFEVRRAHTENEVFKELARQPQYIFSLQAACFDWKLPDGKYLMQEIARTSDTGIVGWVVDSPYYHAAKIKGTDACMHLAIVDYYAAEYIRKYYGIDCHTLHHFGIESTMLPMCERDIDVLVPMSCFSVSAYERKLQTELEENEREIVNDALERLLRDNKLLVSEALEQTFLSKNITLSREEFGDLIEWLEKMVDGYFRAKQRERCVLALLEAGVSLTACGKGWDEFKTEHKECSELRVLSTDMSFQDVAKMMGRSKMVLNIVPMYQEGIHERLATAMLQGAVCLTDPSLFLEKHFTDGEDILFYQWDDLNASFVEVRNYLGDTIQLQEMADKARAIAKKEMGVAKFAEQVMQMMEGVGHEKS